MIYFDAAYIAKCYLNEPGADRVRQVAQEAPGLASCELARVEVAAILLRHLREGHLTRREFAATLKEVAADEAAGVWHWLGLTPALLTRARRAILDLPPTVFVRTGDALHLACAQEHGFDAVYTNDRHMLAAARFFHLAGRNVLEPIG